ncbi:MAG: F0F1 ATP synthase subunit alpha [Patescibacteria group bacterium]|nr:F0F1 ATP synthase subunit alpha [Patescibacteria group bacterium]
MASKKDQIIQLIQKEIDAFKIQPAAEKVGRVIEVGDGIATISGLPDVMSSELLNLSNDTFGVALNLEEDTIGAMVLGDYSKIKEGDMVKKTNRILSVPVSDKLISRVVNPLGFPLDGKAPIPQEKFYPIEKIAPGVISRQSVSVPLQTGIKAIDLMIPIGRGQRELIIGDRQTGKTAIAIDTIVNQKNQDCLCIYVAIGQKESKVAKIVSELEKREAMEHTIVVLAGASDPASFSFIAPYSGCAIGEYFMDKGKDVLIIYDDLSKHAWSYRQISLLLRRPPGREAYPGDIFYLHSRLLERAARLNAKNHGGSLTALPIIETQAGDVSAYIPTNVISITDGQIYLESDLFYQGIRPALNIGLSVSRVGSAAQTKAIKEVAGKLRLDLAQFRELAAFAEFSSDLDETTKKQIERGKRLMEIVKQEQYSPMAMADQVLSVFCVNQGYFDEIKIPSIKKYEKKWLEYAHSHLKKQIEEITKTGQLNDELKEKIEKALARFIKDQLQARDMVPKQEKDKSMFTRKVSPDKNHDQKKSGN